MEKGKKTPEWLIILFLMGLILLLLGAFSKQFAEWLIGPGLILLGVYGIYREYVRGENLRDWGIFFSGCGPILYVIIGIFILGTMIYWTFIR